MVEHPAAACNRIAVDLQALGRLAAGGSKLSDSLRTQAAWLYLKQVDRLDYAMNELFDDASVESP